MALPSKQRQVAPLSGSGQINQAIIPPSVQGLIAPLALGQKGPTNDPNELQRMLEARAINPDIPAVQPDPFLSSRTVEREPGAAYVVPAPESDPFTMMAGDEAIPRTEDPSDIDANIRLATPTQLPDLSTGGAALRSIGEAEEQVSEAFRILPYEKFEEERAQRSGFNVRKWVDLPTDTRANEANAVTYHADNINNKIMRGVDGEANAGIFSNPAVLAQIDADFGLAEDKTHELSSGVLLAYSRAADDIRSRRYKDQVLSDESPMDFVQDPNDPMYEYYAGSKKPTSKTPAEREAEWKQAASEIESQPVLQGFINGIGQSLGRLLSRPSSPTASYAPKQISPLTASALAYNFYESGYMELGRDKHGRVYPYLTTTGESFLNDTRRVSAMYDPEQRHLNVNAPMILSVGAPTRNLAYANLQSLYSKDNRVLNGDYTLQEAAALYTGSVGVTVNPHTLSLLNQMFEDIKQKMVWAMPDHYGTVVPPETRGAVRNAFSTSVYASSISDLSSSKFIEKARELKDAGVSDVDIASTITDINKNKIDQINKHLNDYLKNNLGRGPRFDVVKLSEATQRMFGTATDINVINFSGDIRPGTNFASKPRVVMRIRDSLSLTNKAHAFANAYNTGGASGVLVGSAIHRNLMSMSQEERSLMGALYQIAKVAEDLGYMKVPATRGTPDVYLKALNSKVFDEVANFGRIALGWVNGQLPTDQATVRDLPPAFNGKSIGELFTKKEWSPLISNAIMAFNMKNAMTNGTSVELDGVLETDASQSNAFVISLLIGDPEVSAILGNKIGGGAYDQLIADFKDLRNKAASTLPDDIMETFTGKDDAGVIEGITNLMELARKRMGNAFDKAYARGIVVAGLYGKSPDFMFTEIETMLGLFHGVVSTELDQLIDSVYNGDRGELIKDLTSLYATSMRKHMANLQGYQRAMSHIGAMKAALDGSTKVKSFGSTEIELGISYVVAHDDETSTVQSLFGIDDSIPLQGKSETNLSAPGDYGRGISDITDMKSRTKEINANIADLMDALTEHTTHGDKAKKALPVTLIQSGDAYQMAVAITYANKDIKGLPLNIKSVHDAGITDPSSTLLYINAYNNIAPHILAANSKHIFESLQKSLQDDLVNAISSVNKIGYADIGMKGRYKALSGYFDRLYMGEYLVSRAMKKGRLSGANLDRQKQRDAQTKAILAAALAVQDANSGWYPPTERNAHRRDHMRITPVQFRKLVKLAMENSGLLEAGEQPAVLTSRESKNYVTRNKRAMAKFISNNSHLRDQMAKMQQQVSNTH